MAVIDDILALGENANIRRYHWKDRGRAPAGYVKGMAVAYARAIQGLAAEQPDYAAMAIEPGDPGKDALKWYEQELAAAGATNGAPQDRLRNLFALLLGLGMRESSGQYCEGRDMSAQNVDALTAEAGLFQTSYNSASASPLLRALIERYNGRQDLLATFSEGVSCGLASWEDYGTGKGRAFQKLSKTCPLFAVEYAAILLRLMRRHWGPINSKRAEIRAEAFEMLRGVEALVAGETQVVAELPPPADGPTPQVEKLIAVATAEWEFFGRSTRSLSSEWQIGGDEADEPFSSRVGKYWRAVGDLESTGNTPQPWSAAFISWVFQNAGVGASVFSPSASHSRYIDHIRRHPGKLSLKPTTEPIRMGDLIWNTRDPGVKTHAQAVAKLNAGIFPLSHCDLVVRTGLGWCEAIGGNVSNLDPGGSVTKSTWALNDGKIADPRKTWIGVISNGL